MNVALDVGHIVTAVVGGLLWLVINGLKSELGQINRRVESEVARVERIASTEIERVEKQGELQSVRNGDRIGRLEDSTMKFPAQFEKLERTVIERMGALELKVSTAHPTKQDFENAMREQRALLERFLDDGKDTRYSRRTTKV